MNARRTMTAEARVTRAKTVLLIGQPFYGTLICNLDIKEDTSGRVPTMGTDGDVILWDRAFVNKCTDAELVFVLAHETAHCAHLHHVRRGNRDPLTWNYAADYAINLDLIEGKVGVAPKDAVLVDRRYRGWSAERIYAEIARKGANKPGGPGQGDGAGEDKNGPGTPGLTCQGNGEGQAQGEGQGKVQDPGKCGAVMDGGKTPEELRKSEREWQRNVRQALQTAMKSHGAGSIPGGMQEMLKRLKGIGEDWRHVLRNFVDPSSRQDYSWSRPDRRFAGMPFILPGTVSNGINHIVMARDVSGSIDTDKCSGFTLEGQSMLDQEFIDKLTIIDCDTTIQRVAEFVPGDILPLDVTGRGGTSFRPVWDWVKNSTDDISALVYFTDLDPSDGFGEEPSVPVLWACQDEDSREKPPFGDLTVIGS